MLFSLSQRSFIMNEGGYNELYTVTDVRGDRVAFEKKVCFIVCVSVSNGKNCVRECEVILGLDSEGSDIGDGCVCLITFDPLKKKTVEFQEKKI